MRTRVMVCLAAAAAIAAWGAARGEPATARDDPPIASTQPAASAQTAAAATQPSAATGDAAALAVQVHALLAGNCARCHTPQAEKVGGKLDFILDLTRLAADQRFIVPGKPDKSEVFLIVDEDEMPPRKSHLPHLGEGDKQTIRRWIELGAPAPPAALAALASTAPTSPASTPTAAPPDGPLSPQRLAAWVGNFHMPSVHFPIALLLSAVLAEGLYVVTRRESFKSVVRFCLWVGFLSAVVTASLGWLRAEHGVFAGDLRKWTLLRHRWLGVATVGWAMLAVVAAEFRARRDSPRRRRLVRLALLVGAGIVSAAGAFGGALVYGWDHYAL